jgi:hypothetical protein
MNDIGQSLVARYCLQGLYLPVSFAELRAKVPSNVIDETSKINLTGEGNSAVEAASFLALWPS